MMWIWIIAAIALLALLFPFVKRSMSGLEGADPLSSNGQKSPMEILEKRYARGEIDQAEFEQKRRQLTE